MAILFGIIAGTVVIFVAASLIVCKSMSDALKQWEQENET